MPELVSARSVVGLAVFRRGQGENSPDLCIVRVARNLPDRLPGQIFVPMAKSLHRQGHHCE